MLKEDGEGNKINVFISKPNVIPGPQVNPRYASACFA